MEISVIVPVYNVEPYLRRCVDSILNQTYRDFELILVDDGSTDNSSSICDEYQKAHPFIRVFHKQNGGLSDARNYGIERATGKYVTFIDSDDYVTTDYLQCLHGIAVTYGADIACAHFGFVDDRSAGCTQSATMTDQIRVYSGEDACTALLYGRDFYTSACCQLIRADIAAKNLFPVGKYHEDEQTTFRCFLSASTVAITNRVLYYYYQREGSIMHTFGQPVMDEIFAADNYAEYCKPLTKTLYKAALCKRYCLYTAVIRDYPQIKTAYPDLYSRVVRFLRRYSIFMVLDVRTSLAYKKMAVSMLMRRYG